MEVLTENIVRALIAVNMRRMYRYQNARDCVDGAEIRQLLSAVAAQSEGFVMELEYVLRLYGGSIGTAASQDLADTTFHETGDPQHAVHSVLLKLFKDDKETMKEYEKHLINGNDLDNDLFERIRTQQSEIRESQLKLERLISD